MYKAAITLRDGSRTYRQGEDIDDHPRLQELIKRGLVKEIKTVKPDESKKQKKQRKQSNK